MPRDDPRCGRAARHDLGGALLLPGFVDTQVNGGGGVLFNDEPTVETIRTIGARASALRHDRLPAHADQRRPRRRSPRAIDAVRAAIARGVPGVLGIHIEGPFLSAARKGVARLRASSATSTKAPSALLTSLRGGRTLVTLAPEMTTPGIIATLAAAGVIVSAGHTNATYGEMRAALGTA